jgi:integrase
MASRLYSWADESDLVPAEFNPAKMKRLKVRQKSIVPWSEEEIALFLSHCPAWLKTPILLALHTGQRREDVAAMEWDNFQGASIRVRQSKTGEPLDIACHKELRAHLMSVKTKFGGPIARTAKGRPFTANGLEPSGQEARQRDRWDAQGQEPSRPALCGGGSAGRRWLFRHRGGCGYGPPHLSDGAQIHGSAPRIRGRNG